MGSLTGMTEFTEPGLLTDRETVPPSLSHPQTSPDQMYALGTMLRSALSNAMYYGNKKKAVPPPKSKDGGSITVNDGTKTVRSY